MGKNPLIELDHLGQSVWVDYIRRGMLISGELEKLIHDDGIKGVTSNPTIFEKAIGGSTDYNEALRLAVPQGKNLDEIYDFLILEDIGKAADLFLPVFKKTHGADGFISIEVSPELASDTNGSVKEAHRLFALLDRPNIMVKIPGTPQGIPAIEKLLTDGVNINITLLFSLENYEQVMEAYVSALENRVKKGQPIDHIASVASFFVSRVDTLTDTLLNEKIAAEKNPAEQEKIKRLLGKTAVANAKLAYQKFKEVFQSSRFETLQAKGAKVQRPLWASTSTKNPNYSDILYVQELIAKDSVNTMPLETIHAFKDHGKPRLTIEENLEEAECTLQQLAVHGVSLTKITKKLQEDGVKAFSDSFKKLLQEISTKRDALRSGKQKESAVGLNRDDEKAIETRQESLKKNELIKRLWEKDASLWKKDPAVQKEIKSRLGWLHIIGPMKEQASRLQKFALQVKDEGFTSAVLLGMGGSSLCPEVLSKTFGSASGYPKLMGLDTTDPATILETEKSIDLNKTLFIVSSKSGDTTETSSLFQYFYRKIPKGENFIAITDEGTPLQRLAAQKSFREIFINPADIGGRYSALSYFGLVPGALIGLDIKKLLERAEQMAEACAACIDVTENPGARLGSLLGESVSCKKDKITFIMSNPIHAFGGWVEQLLAESTGKEGKGLVPVDGEPVGEPSVYGNDRVFIVMDLPSHPIHGEEIKKLQQAGYPVIRLTLEDPYDLGGEFFRWEFATAVAGAIMGINAFDQPNVQESKDNTKALLEEFKIKGVLPEGPSNPQDSDLKSLLQTIKPGDYIALMAYFQQTSGREKMLRQIRQHWRDRFHVATTLGYGPRFLHSTGQLHKGGANNGVFIQFTADDPQDLPIPGAPYSFSILKRAQALGDFRALKAHQRRVIHLHLGKNIEQSLQQILAHIEETLAVKR